MSLSRTVCVTIYERYRTDRDGPVSSPCRRKDRFGEKAAGETPCRPKRPVTNVSVAKTQLQLTISNTKTSGCTLASGESRERTDCTASPVAARNVDVNRDLDVRACSARAGLLILTRANDGGYNHRVLLYNAQPSRAPLIFIIRCIYDNKIASPASSHWTSLKPEANCVVPIKDSKLDEYCFANQIFCQSHKVSVC